MRWLCSKIQDPLRKLKLEIVKPEIVNVKKTVIVTCARLRDKLRGFRRIRGGKESYVISNSVTFLPSYTEETTHLASRVDDAYIFVGIKWWPKCCREINDGKISFTCLRGCHQKYIFTISRQ